MIEQHEVDGVPTLLAPADGPMRAGLVFRVGQADETLARKGITHLVEHLALFSFGATDYHYNGVTGNAYTLFHTQGDSEEIATFLTGVCASLRDLPMTRVATEKEILRTEASGRGTSVGDGLGLWRHGARDFGLSGYPEWGLQSITEDDLRSWASRYFTRENAVLWVVGDAVPTGLRLDLPAGARMPLPQPSSALPRTPAFFASPSNALGWDTVLPRDTESAVFADMVERRMFRELRQEAGLSYTVGVSSELLTADTVLVTAIADALPEKQGALLGGFVDLMAALRVGRITEDEVTAVLGKRCDDLSQAEKNGGRLPGQALNLLVGNEIEQLDEVLAQTRAVTRDDMVERAAEAYGKGLLLTPVVPGPAWAGYAAAPTRSEQAVDGTAYRGRPDGDRRLIIGSDGVTLADHGEFATVRFDALAAMLAWPDGGRRLIGHDAIAVSIEPSLYRGLSAAMTAVDRRVPDDLRVDMPPRSPDMIPSPARVPWRRRLRARLRVPHVAILKLILPSAMLSLACLALAIGIAVVGFTGDRALQSVAAFGILLVAAARYARRARAVIRAMR
ncbi:insulinase family protein [Actinoplanes sp. TBRC 11911]|uniref:M16 family metallopeptidase n=1 Tax=Actinoplanes sp. TBRC 11911 TaxID=2729386 RepID=UPI00145D1B78|nr:insulinase family protein [Actinoplanes sp. TBRC 11911]NMO57043.1 insulinase family protein [Actinoplanes sp. TBRC 11911]